MPRRATFLALLLGLIEQLLRQDLGIGHRLIRLDGRIGEHLGGGEPGLRDDLVCEGGKGLGPFQIGPHHHDALAHGVEGTVHIVAVVAAERRSELGGQQDVVAAPVRLDQRCRWRGRQHGQWQINGLESRRWRQV